MTSSETLGSRILADSQGLSLIEQATTAVAMQRGGNLPTIPSEVILAAVGEAVAELSESDQQAFHASQRNAELRAVKLRAFGLTLDVFAQGLPGEPNHTYEPGKTPLRKMISKQDRVGTVPGLEGSFRAETTQDTGMASVPVATTLGMVQPTIQVGAVLQAFRPGNHEYYKHYRTGSDEFGPGGDILKGAWGVGRIVLEAGLRIVPVAGDELTISSEDLPRIVLNFDASGNLRERDSFVGRPIRNHTTTPQPLDPRVAHEHLDAIEGLVQSFAYRPGTQGIKNYLEQR